MITPVNFTWEFPLPGVRFVWVQRDLKQILYINQKIIIL